MRIASSASWVTTIEVARVSCRMASVSSRIFSRNRGSSPENGSSIKSTPRPGAVGRGRAPRRGGGGGGAAWGGVLVVGKMEGGKTEGGPAGTAAGDGKAEAGGRYHSESGAAI